MFEKIFVGVTMQSKIWVLLTCFIAAVASETSPCATDNLRCIGKYLAQKSKCNPSRLARRDLIEPLRLDSIHIEYPGFNVSEDRTDVVYSGLGDGYVKNFFIDEETDKAVLTIQVPMLEQENTVNINYYRPGNETFTITSRGISTIYEETIFTILFESASNLELKDAKIYTYLVGPTTWNLGDGAISRAAETNSQVAAVLAAVSSTTTIVSLEGWSYKAPSVVKAFLDSRICRYSK